MVFGYCKGGSFQSFPFSSLDILLEKRKILSFFHSAKSCSKREEKTEEEEEEEKLPLWKKTRFL